MAASTARACLRRLSPFVYSHNNSQASARSGMRGFCSTRHKKAQAEPQKGTKLKMICLNSLSFCGLFLCLFAAYLELVARYPGRARIMTFLRVVVTLILRYRSSRSLLIGCEP